jgi:hypothetical protein
MDYFEVCYRDRKRIARQRDAEPHEVQDLPNSVICNGISLLHGSVEMYPVITVEDAYDCRPVCGPAGP